MTDFFRFPSTPHLAWLGPGTPRGDKVLPRDEARELLRHELVVEEKVDGANLGLWVDGPTVRAQNRGSLLQPGGHPQWGPLWPWLDARRDVLLERLPPGLVVFGEWCVARHSVAYSALPDWWLVFDVWDRQAARFWSTRRRDALASVLHLCVVPTLAVGRFDLPGLVAIVERGESALGATRAEGVVVRRDDHDHLASRAKLVHPQFMTEIDTHWSAGPLVRNRLRDHDDRAQDGHSR